MLATLPGRTQGLGLITEPMLRDLQLDRVTYANINLWATLLGAAICLPIGRLFDRVGLRGATFALTLLLGAVVWTMSRLAGGAVAAVPARAGHARARAERAVGRQHHRRRQVVRPSRRRGDGRLLGAAERVLRGGVHRRRELRSGSAAGAPPGLRSRSGWSLFAAPVVLLLRERPAHPASDPAEAAPAMTGCRSRRRFARRRSGSSAARRRCSAWCRPAWDSSTKPCSPSAASISRPTSRFWPATSIIALAGQLACGWLTLRWSMQRLLGLAMFIYAVALAALPLLTTLSQLWIFAALIGLSGGMITVLFFAVWRHAFGPAHLGRIQGAAQMLTVLASAIGPLIFAQCAALTGSYTPALWTLAPCVLLLSVAAFRVTMPELRPPYS